MGCRTAAPQAELLRLAVAPPGHPGAGAEAVPDPERRLPGRGAYLHPDPACVEQALRRRALPRALRTGVCVPVETLEWIDQWQRSASTR